MMNFRTCFACAASVLGLALFSVSAQASADQSCVPYITTLASSFRCDVLGYLVPANDTRDNMIFLMADRQKQALTSWPAVAADPGFLGTYGEGSVCVSDGSGSAGFVAAVASDTTIPDGEQDVLVAARQALKCQSNPDTPSVTPQPLAVQSTTAKEFAAYLAATAYFYQGNHTDPAGFSALANASQPGCVRRPATCRPALHCLPRKLRPLMTTDIWSGPTSI